jgi:DNA-binding Lrp family transcriptional regulator
MYNKVDYPLDPSSQSGNQEAEKHTASHINYGHILEKVIRKDRMSISEISRQLNISRRTLYNWFETENLDLEIIRRVGILIDHDFSKELPEEFAQLAISPDMNLSGKFTGVKSSDAIYYWMDRYIRLLEKFNEVLTH